MKGTGPVAIALLLTAVACGGDDSSGAGTTTTTAPDIDPSRFSATIDNPYLPMRAGMRWVYETRTDEGVERAVVEVTTDTREVMGVTCVVVKDHDTLDGELTEETFDWFAQDDEGNVWYFGEDTREFEDGVAVNAKGAWEAGIDGARPGIVMPTDPQVGDEYRQEFAEGVAEDEAEVLQLDDTATVPVGRFDHVLRTEDRNPLEPGQVEHKYYAEGVGLVLTVKTEGDGQGDRAELVERTAP